MRVNRRLLYWGVFLVAIGGVLVVADLGGLDSGVIADGLRLWPLAFVAIGAGIVLRRTSLSLPSGLFAAAVPGLFLGAGFAVAPGMAVDCGDTDAPPAAVVREGSFDGPARVSVSAGCGALVVTTAPGDTWQLATGATSDLEPVVTASSRSLEIDARGDEGWAGHFGDGDDWQVTLPTSAIDELSLVMNAGHGRIDLPDGQIGRLDVTTNASQTSVDLSDASVSSLSGTVNAGMLSFRLPAGVDVTGSLDVNAGALEVCVPDDLGLRVSRSGSLGGISVNGRHEAAEDWQSLNYASAAHRADLDVDVNFGSVAINPTGGCK